MSCFYCKALETRWVLHNYRAIRGTLHRFDRVVCDDHEGRVRADAASWRLTLEREDAIDNGALFGSG